jgi:hypothetical protein
MELIMRGFFLPLTLVFIATGCTTMSQDVEEKKRMTLESIERESKENSRLTHELLDELKKLRYDMAMMDGNRTHLKLKGDEKKGKREPPLKGSRSYVFPPVSADRSGPKIITVRRDPTEKKDAPDAE